MKLALVIPALNSDYGNQLSIVAAKFPTETLRIRQHDLTMDFVRREQIDVVLAAELPIELCYLLRGMELVTVVLGSRGVYVDLVDIVIDFKHPDHDHYFTGPAVDFTKESADSLIEIVGLVKRLEWDSNFFALNIAFISCLHLSTNIYKAINRYVIKNKIDLVEYLSNCHDRRSVLIAGKEGFTFADIRLTFYKNLDSWRTVQQDNNLEFRQAVEEDIPALEEMAAGMYVKSRYFFDNRFGLEKAKQFYQGWISKAVRAQFDDECWCLTNNKKIVSFCSLKYGIKSSASIGLIGVHKSYANRGIGRLMLESVLNKMAERGLKKIFVVTQGRNYPAQNLYQGVGFKTKETQLWYHKWIS
jgi:dTDP-4-amino-4,6-dideoxy-D-galactose acyltransferase